jgi:hypothetical protein
MRAFLGSLLVVGFLAACADGADRQDQLFASWQDAQRDVKSLVVEFTLETWDTSFQAGEKAEGTFRLIRTANGDVLASCEVREPQAKGEKRERWSGLLHKGTVYLLNDDKKTAIRFEPADGDVPRFLEKHFNPFVLLIEQKRAAEKCELEVVKQDERHTYLGVKPKQVKRSGWFPDTFHEGRAVLMNEDSEEVPKDMPRQLWYTDGVREHTFQIKSWQMNRAEPPKVEEFAKPEDRPGWQVGTWVTGRLKETSAGRLKGDQLD